MSTQRVAAIVSIAAVVAAVVAGLLIIGSPAEQRLQRFDERRANDLTRVSFAVRNRWNERQVLPRSLEELVDGQLLSRLPVDPSTDASYEYRVTGPREFELCAVFDRPSRPEAAGDFWFHDAGRRCFAFDVVERLP